MKKILLGSLLCMLFCAQLVFAVPAENPYSLKLCNVILNPAAVDGYQLIVFDEDGGNPKIVEEDACVEGVLYLLPDKIDLDDIEIKKVEAEDYFDGVCYEKTQKRDVKNLGAMKLGGLKSRCAQVDECSGCHHPDSSPSWTDRLIIKYNENYGKEASEWDSQYIIDLYKQKYVLGLYKWVDRIDEENLKSDKFKAWNKESGEGIPVKDTYDERDIPGSLPEDNRSMLEQYIALNNTIISKILLGLVCLVAIPTCIYFKKKESD